MEKDHSISGVLILVLLGAVCVTFLFSDVDTNRVGFASQALQKQLANIESQAGQGGDVNGGQGSPPTVLTNEDGFIITYPNQFEFAVSVTFADLNNDLEKEIIVLHYDSERIVDGTGQVIKYPESKISLYNKNGQALDSVSIENLEITGKNVAIGDVNNDGILEIVGSVSYIDQDSDDPHVFVLNYDGSTLNIESIHTLEALVEDISTPTLKDVNGDSVLDIIVTYSLTGGSALITRAFSADENTYWRETTQNMNIITKASYGDMNGDGVDEFATAVNNIQIQSPEWSGKIIFKKLNGHQATVPDISYTNELVQNHPIIGDLDNDGFSEVVFATRERNAFTGNIYAYDKDGNLLSGFPQNVPDMLFGLYPAVADLDGDNDLEIFAFSHDGHLNGWHHDGNTINGWPVFVNNNNFYADSKQPIIMDLTGDGVSEVLYIKNCVLHAYRSDGQVVSGYPIDVSAGSSCVGSVSYSIEPLDTTGAIYLGIPSGGVHIKKLNSFFDPSMSEWAFANHDKLNSGNYENKCSDNTVVDSCSSTKPMMCNHEKQLVNDCQNCGCPSGKTCKPNGQCKNIPSGGSPIFSKLATDDARFI